MLVYIISVFLIVFTVLIIQNGKKLSEKKGIFLGIAFLLFITNVACIFIYGSSMWILLLTNAVLNILLIPAILKKQS